MESAIGIVLQLSNTMPSSALELGWHGDWRQRKEWHREREYQVRKMYIL